MIGQIRGVILEKQPPQIVIDVQGIGYEIDAPMSTFYHLPEVAQHVHLYTHFVVREDAHCLYGFFTREERHLFRTLIKVNGVGPRLALAILSGATADEFMRHVLNNDCKSLVRLPGIGNKIAERLIIELKDKFANLVLHTPVSGTHTEGLNTRHQILQDSISALIALGYKQNEANRTITKIDDGIANSEDLIRKALREMM